MYELNAAAVLPQHAAAQTTPQTAPAWQRAVRKAWHGFMAPERAHELCHPAQVVAHIVEVIAEDGIILEQQWVPPSCWLIRVQVRT